MSSQAVADLHLCKKFLFVSVRRPPRSVVSERRHVEGGVVDDNLMSR